MPVYQHGRAAVLRVVGAYIELNPVRAGLAERAEAYRWSGWGAATGGEVSASQRAWARAGIVEMLGEETREGEEGRRFLESYGFLLRVKDDVGDSGDSQECGSRRSEHRRPGLLRGAVVGTRSFVERWTGRLGRKRETPPVPCGSGSEEATIFHARRHRIRCGRAAVADEAAFG
ncbi:MAG: hypothetical protein JJU00_05280 [Opitutales bacterium]|nr:hypothetical protein [Opitutales bacterium]